MKRHSGILLSISSLPSKYGIGCFDTAAYEFVDFLEKAGQKYWQILPLGATSHGEPSDSPYQAYSAFAGNPYFINLEALIGEGVLTKEECDEIDFGKDPAKVDYNALFEKRFALLHKAYERSNINENPAFHDFCGKNYWWLDDYALFMAVREFFGGAKWTEWPEDIRMHYAPALSYYHEKLYFEVEFQKYMQFKFWEHWSSLKRYANEKGIMIVGDMPIYVSPDGSDVWAQPELFQLNEHNMPSQVAGCPPDNFSADGQIWGNPLYRWDHHRYTGYQWWTTRMWYSYQLYDMVRLDHFRGFDEYYAIPVGGTALDGHWEKGPGMELFYTLRNRLGEKAIIAEDLGLITDSVRHLVWESGFPNMKVLQFGFEKEDKGGTNEYLPHNYYTNNCVIYTGTHDNDTICGWFKSLDEETENLVRGYLGAYDTPAEKIHTRFISAAMMCNAETCIVPMQDWLGLDSSARMNLPGTVDVNWKWRLKKGQVTDKLAEQIYYMTKVSKRAR